MPAWHEYPDLLLAHTTGFRVTGTPETVRRAFGAFLGTQPVDQRWFATGHRLRPYRCLLAADGHTWLWTLPPATEAAHAWLDVAGAESITPEILPVPAEARKLLLTLRTPIVPDGRVAGGRQGFLPPDPDRLVQSLAWRITRLVKCYIDPSWVPDPVVVTGAHPLSADGAVVKAHHASTHHDGVFMGNGWVGSVLWEADPAWITHWWPWLVAGSIWGVGRGTAWGHASFDLTALTSGSLWSA